ncbi:MAG: energy transducer TonB [Chitinophagaceae bacterium]
MKYLVQNMVYPTQCEQKNIQGRVIVNFTIDTVGQISNIKVIQCPKECTEFGEVAVRIIKNMPRWRPGYQNGKPVIVIYNMPFQWEMH